MEVVCEQCGKSFKILHKEYNRILKLRRNYFFCGPSCSISHSNQNRHDSDASRLNPNNRKDEFSPFRWFLGRIRNRPKKGSSDIDVLFLKGLWKKQKGICPFTDFQMILPRDTAGWPKGKNIKNASLDRINCSKGYIKGNVRFVCFMANIARSDFSDIEMIKFCKAVSCTLKNKTGVEGSIPYGSTI